MPRVVVILPSNTYRAADFVAAADSLNIDLVVASEQPPPFDMGDRYLQIDCADVTGAAETIARLGDGLAIDGVVAADDAGVVVAAQATTLLGLRGNPPDGAAATRNKLLMRTRLAAAEVDQPRFAAIQPTDNPEGVGYGVGYPLVMKPLDRSASQGVIRVDFPEDTNSTAARIRSIVGEDATLLVESFVSGDEIAIEGLVRGGELRVLAVFDKPDTSPGPYFPETLFITPSRLPEEILGVAERVASGAVRGLGLIHGPVHIELRVDGTRARVIEVAARSIGGLCSRSLNFGLTGTSLESLILRNAIGTDKESLHREPVASGVLMIPTPGSGVLSGVTGQSDIRELPEITGIDLTIRPGEQVESPPEGRRYLGFVYARAKTPELVETALRKAKDKLEVQLEG